MTDNDAALALTACSKYYGEQAALDDVTISVPRGQITGIVGPNGSGKSTMLACIVGMEKLTSGHLTVEGAAVGTDAAKSAVVFTPDDLPMPELLTGREFLELICQLECRPHGIGTALRIAEVFGIAGAMNKLIGGYSHGMRRRLQFAAALSSESEILIMDEPFSGLDVEGAYLLRSALSDWRDQGRTVVVTLHELRSAQRECDHLVVLAAGRVVASGRPTDLIDGCRFADLEDLVLTLSGTLDYVKSNSARLHELIAVGCPPMTLGAG